MGTTPLWALRYPANTDQVAQGYLNVQQLAEDVDAALLYDYATRTTNLGVTPGSTTTALSFTSPTLTSGHHYLVEFTAYAVVPQGAVLTQAEIFVRIAGTVIGSCRVLMQANTSGYAPVVARGITTPGSTGTYTIDAQVKNVNPTTPNLTLVCSGTAPAILNIRRIRT